MGFASFVFFVSFALVESEVGKGSAFTVVLPVRSQGKR